MSGIMMLTSVSAVQKILLYMLDVDIQCTSYTGIKKGRTAHQLPGILYFAHKGHLIPCRVLQYVMHTLDILPGTCTYHNSQDVGHDMMLYGTYRRCHDTSPMILHYVARPSFYTSTHHIHILQQQ